MDDLFGEIANATGIDPASARKAVGIIVGFVGKEAPLAMTDPVFDKLPGARALAIENAAVSGGLLGVLNDLTGAGLGLAEIQTVVTAFVAYAKTRAGDREVDALVKAIPGLDQFL